MLVLPNVTWNHQMWEEKKKGTIECNKSTVTYNVDTTQCDNGTIKYERKKN